MVERKMRARMAWSTDGDDEVGDKGGRFSRPLKRLPSKGMNHWFKSFLLSFTILLTVLSVWSMRERSHGHLDRSRDAGSRLRMANMEGVLDAVVYIAIGPESESGDGSDEEDSNVGMLRLSIESLRKVGGFGGEVVIITDMGQLLRRPGSLYGAKLIEFEGFRDLRSLKGNYYNAICDLKTKIFDYFPSAVEKVLYLDTDVIVSGPLGPLLQDLEQNFLDRQRPDEDAPTIALFKNNAPCGKGYPCWHAGVIFVTREHSSDCLERWHDYHMSYGYPLCVSKLTSTTRKEGLPAECNDQSALSWASYTTKSCRKVYKMDDSIHLRWMNSALMVSALGKLAAPTRTFSHFTHNTRKHGHLGKGMRGSIYRFMVTNYFLRYRLGLFSPFDA